MAHDDAHDHGGNGHAQNGANGANGNGHRVEPAWLQKLKAGDFSDDE